MITQLQPNQVFVFGSNLAGIHGAGAALQAKRDFGAKQGCGIVTGRSDFGGRHEYRVQWDYDKVSWHLPIELGPPPVKKEVRLNHES